MNIDNLNSRDLRECLHIALMALNHYERPTNWDYTKVKDGYQPMGRCLWLDDDGTRGDGFSYARSAMQRITTLIEGEQEEVPYTKTSSPSSLIEEAERMGFSPAPYPLPIPQPPPSEFSIRDPDPQAPSEPPPQRPSPPRVPNRLMRHFTWAHLSPPFALVSQQFGLLAQELDKNTPECAEKTAGLRKLLEAKDCFVRAKIEALSTEK